MDEWMDGGVGGWVDGDEWVDRWTEGAFTGWMGGRKGLRGRDGVNGWVEGGWMGGDGGLEVERMHRWKEE